MVWLIFTKFGMMMQSGSLNCPVKNLNFKNRRWRTAAILKTIQSSYIRNCLTDFDPVWHSDAEQVSTPLAITKYRIFKLKMVVS